jgi:hypothetical protein
VLLPLPDRLQTSQIEPVSRNFLTTDHGEQIRMSYAGPASRAARAEVQLVGARSTGRTGSPNPRARSQTSVPREGRTTIFAAGLLVGLAIGAGVALLVAPQSGLEARRALMRRGRLLRRRGVNAWDDLRDELRRVRRRQAEDDEEKAELLSSDF